MSEEWRDIPGFDGKYQASSYGRIRSLSFNKTKQIRPLSISQNRAGYCLVALQINNKSKRILVHRLIALTFIPNKDNKPQVNHIDGDKSNNRLDNLEWVTGKENVRHFHHVLMKRPIKIQSGRKRGWQSKPVICVETGERYESIASAARSIGVSEKAISQLLKNPTNRHTAKGFHWKLA